MLLITLLFQFLKFSNKYVRQQGKKDPSVTLQWLNREDVEF